MRVPTVCLHHRDPDKDDMTDQQSRSCATDKSGNTTHVRFAKPNKEDDASVIREAGGDFLQRASENELKGIVMPPPVRCRLSMSTIIGILMWIALLAAAIYLNKPSTNRFFQITTPVKNGESILN